MAEAVDSHTYKCIRLQLGIYDERRRYPYYWMGYGQAAYYRYYGHHFPSGAADYPSWKNISKNRKQWMRKRFYLHRCVFWNDKESIDIRK